MAGRFVFWGIVVGTLASLSLAAQAAEPAARGYSSPSPPTGEEASGPRVIPNYVVPAPPSGAPAPAAPYSPQIGVYTPLGQPAPYVPSPAPELSQALNRRVHLQLKFLEISLTKLRAQGLTLPSEGLPHVEEKGEAVRTTAADRLMATRGGAPSWGPLEDDSPVLQSLETLLDKQVAQVLSEPELVTLVGRPASFCAGGEFPVMVVNGNTVSTEWKKYGLRLDTSPNIVGETLRLELRVSLSELDPKHGVTLNGFKVPGVRVACEMETALSVKPGQVFLLCGPTQLRCPTVEESPSDEESPTDEETEAAEEMASSGEAEEVQQWLLIRPYLEK